MYYPFARQSLMGRNTTARADGGSRAVTAQLEDATSSPAADHPEDAGLADRATFAADNAVGGVGNPEGGGCVV